MDAKKLAIIALAIIIVLAVAVPFVGYYVIKAPADAQYNRKFASHVIMAYDQATFEGQREQVVIVWAEMNRTFAGMDFEHTYSTWWYVDQNYENSLKAQEDYFRQLLQRIDNMIREQQDILAGNKTILMPYNQWYQQALNDTRTEMKREGGLDWAINGTWYLTFAPLAYWFNTGALFWTIIMVILGIIAGIIAFGED